MCTHYYYLGHLISHLLYFNIVNMNHNICFRCNYFLYKLILFLFQLNEQGRRRRATTNNRSKLKNAFLMVGRAVLGTPPYSTSCIV